MSDPFVAKNESKTGWVVLDRDTGEQLLPPQPGWFYGHKKRALREAAKLRKAAAK